MGGLLQLASEILIPSWREFSLSLAVALFIVLLISLLQHTFSWTHHTHDDTDNRIHDPTLPHPASAQLHDFVGGHNSKVPTKVDHESPSIYLIKLQLLAARNLVAANLNGTSDPYVVLTCGAQKRFSSMVPNSRNPMWGEEFDFYTDELPAQLDIAIYDWDILWKSTQLGSVTVIITTEGQTEAVWHMLDRASGQVCVQTCTRCCAANSIGVQNAPGSTVVRRRLSIDKPVGTEVRQKPGPLQTIFGLPPDEVVEHSYSCAMERSFLYHGRMYVSSWHICFHSNVFAKQMKVILALQDVEEIRRSQHALINPAITIVLRAGSGGHGVPPLSSPDGRAKYKFASFWNRNHSHRVLLRAAKNYHAMDEAAKMEKQQSLMRAQSGTFQNLHGLGADFGADSRAKPYQPFIENHALVEIKKVGLPCTVHQFFSVLLSDGSRLIDTYRTVRKDTDVKVEKWKISEEYGGLVRKITFRALCQSPMCPPDTAMTEWHHVAPSTDKLVFETVQQAHEVPFGNCFEVQAEWTVQKASERTCTVTVRVGAHFKKCNFMQSKITSGIEKEYKADAELILEIATKFFETANTGVDDKAEKLQTALTM